MPEARDRRVTPLDVATIYARRRASFIGAFDLDPLPLGSGPTGPQRNATRRGRARPLHAPGAENTPPRTARRGRVGRGSSRSVLPSWYPRTPLRDITAIVRAIERRSRLGIEEERQQIGTPIPEDRLFPEPSSGASEISPKSVGVKIRTPAGSKVPKIVLDIAKLPEEGDSELLTPEKKLLNSIDKVEKVVRQELQRLKRNPSAKKAEREKRVRTLMSMR